MDQWCPCVNEVDVLVSLVMHGLEGDGSIGRATLLMGILSMCSWTCCLIFLASHLVVIGGAGLIGASPLFLSDATWAADEAAKPAGRCDMSSLPCLALSCLA